MARVLVVEDTPSSLELMEFLLRAFGHDVDATSSSEDGLNRALSESYDAILTDIFMPGMDGYAFVARFREQRPESSARVIAVTALAMVGDKERLLAAGFDGYIAKPIDPEQFVRQVEKFVEAPATGPLILAVDDLDANLDVLEHTLQPFGFRVKRAHSVLEASTLMSRERPDLVICDVHMRGGDGYELIEFAKGDERFRSIPFFVMSSTAWSTPERQRALELGANKFILRPIEPAELLEAVRAATGA